MPDRYYDVAEANSQIAELTTLFERVLVLRTQLKRLVPGGPSGGHKPRSEDRHVVRALMATLDDTTEQIAALGCVIKDVEIGLVDWPARHQGRDIWLCWRYGEAEVGFWHEVDAGYAGRRPVAELTDPREAKTA